MRQLVMLLVLPFAVSAFGCGDDDPLAGGPLSEGDRLFSIGPSPEANSAQIEGVWEAKTPRVQSGLESFVRLELRRDRVVAAVRCVPTDGGDATVLGEAGRAAVSATTLEFPDEVRVSRSLGKSYCGVVVHAGVLPQCDLRKLVTERSWCFELAKGTLTVREETAAIEYVKVSD